MAASDRRAAVWPWLVMPLIVLLVFYALHRLQHPARTSAAPAGAVSTESPAEQ
jgi:hypothetical protein